MADERRILLTLKVDKASAPDYVGVAADVAQKFAETCGFSADDAGEFAIAADEIISNAIRHGNKFDPAKSSVLCLYDADDRILAYAQDESEERFDPTPYFKKTPNDITPDELLKGSGRGFIFIGHYTDSQRYEWLSPGNRVWVEKMKSRKLSSRSGRAGQETPLAAHEDCYPL